MPQYYCSAFSVSATAEFDLQILTGIQQCVAHFIFKYTIKAMFELQNQRNPIFHNGFHIHKPLEDYEGTSWIKCKIQK